MKSKILSAIGAAVLSLGLVLGSAIPASAATNNRVEYQGNGCIKLMTNTGFIYRECGFGSVHFNINAVIVEPYTCKQIGYWTFTTYCASKASRYVYLSSNQWYWVR